MLNAVAEHLATEIALAHPRHLDEVISRVWRTCAEGKIDADTAGELDQAARDRRRGGGPKPSPQTAPATRRPSRSPDRQRSIARRRRECSSGMMPPAIAALFSEGERSALAVIAKEFKLRGQCDLFIDQIAAFAGVGRSTVKSATRRAKQCRLLEVEEWKQAPDRNGPNCIRIVSPEWLTWLAHHREVKMTVKLSTTTHNQIDKRGRFATGSSISRAQSAEGGGLGNAARGYRKEKSASAVPVLR